MSSSSIIANPALTVGEDNKQGWNQVANRRHGFHHAHKLFRRTFMVRSRNVLTLKPATDGAYKPSDELNALINNPAFSALCCLRNGKIIVEAAADDFSTSSPHSIQSISKMHIHIIAGKLIEQGLLSLEAKVVDYLPTIGSGYSQATVQSLLDMAVTNDFTEDYDDPNSDCYTEEMALGWRLPANDEAEPLLADFVTTITGFKASPARVQAEYKSANTDVLTLVAAAVSPVPLSELIEQIADAAGYEGAFHISLSKDGYPAFSGGGCFSARDLARFGLLLAREGQSINGGQFTNAAFTQQSLTRNAPTLTPPKEWLRYSNHLMTDGQVFGHAGYGGQFLMINPANKTACAFFSVLLNDSGYDEGYMGEVARVLREVCLSA